MYSTVQYNTIQYSTVQYSTVQYSTEPGEWLVPVAVIWPHTPSPIADSSDWERLLGVSGWLFGV